MTEKKKFHHNSTLKLKFSQLENKEMHYKLPSLKLKPKLFKLNTYSLLPKRESSMLEENSTQPQKERNKRKNNVNHGEVNMLETLNKEPLKLVSLDKLNKS